MLYLVPSSFILNEHFVFTNAVEKHTRIVSENMNLKNKNKGNRSWADVVKQQPKADAVKQQPRNIMKGKNENTNDKVKIEK